MRFFRKAAGTILIILFIASIFKDLTVGTVENPPEKAAPAPPATQTEKNSPVQENIQSSRFLVKQVQIEAGDTVLSVIEELNETGTVPGIDQAITDFLALNPETEPDDIKPTETYLFPVYSATD